MSPKRIATLTLLPLMALPLSAGAAVIYVDTSASGSGDGSSWTNAYPQLAAALPTATAGDEVRVAAGIYRPTEIPGDRAATFTVPDGVRLLGGYAPGGSDEPDWQTHLTILSGDIEGDDLDFDGDATGYAESTEEIVGENSIHVLTMSGTSSDTAVQGFVISAGYSFDITCDFPPTDECSGAGILNVGGSPELSNLLFSANQNAFGGGIANLGGAPAITGVLFQDNNGGLGGGGIYNLNASPTITRTTFTRNSGVGGGGVHNRMSHPVIADSLFVENLARFGGAVFNIDSNPVIQRVRFEDNGNRTVFLAGEGGAINNRNSSPLIIDVDFIRNVAGATGGAVHSELNSTPVMDRVRFDGNAAESLGGAVYSTGGSTLRLDNGLFRRNVNVALANGDAGLMSLTNVAFYANPTGAIRIFSSTLELVNASFGGNFLSPSNRCSAVDLSGTFVAMTVRNTIVWNENPGGPEPFCTASAAMIQVGHSLIDGCNPAGAWNPLCGTDLGGNVPDADPLYVETPDATGFPTVFGDLHLDPASPARDAGDDDANLLLFDLDGRSRIVGPAIDLGAYEWRPPTLIFNNGFESRAP